MVAIVDLAAGKSLERLDLRLDPLMALQCLAHMRDQHFAGRGQPQAPRHALENRRSDLGLERQNLPVDRRRGDVEPCRSLADRSEPGNLVEVFQQPGMQHVPVGVPCPLLVALPKSFGNDA